MAWFGYVTYSPNRIETMHYQANRGGHAPGHLRDAFSEWVELTVYGHGDGIPRIDEEPVDPAWLLDQLWNCADIMPAGLCADLDVPSGSTYAIGANAVRYGPIRVAFESEV